VASTPSADTPPARSAASLVSSAKPSVLHKPSPSKPRSERMAAARPPDTTLCAHRSCATALLQRYSNWRPNHLLHPRIGPDQVHLLRHVPGGMPG
jgi:hypothetical protein